MWYQDMKWYFFGGGFNTLRLYFFTQIKARIAQLVAYRLGTREVPGSNPGKGEKFSVKISNWIVRI